MTRQARLNRHVRPTRLVIGCLATLLGAPALADARVIRLDISRVESPTFDGVSFGDTGPYEKLVGRVVGGIDPADPSSAVITDIDLAPRNAGGMVEYSADLFILRPVDASKGNGRLFFEVNNRGSLLSLGQLNDARSGGSDPTAAADAGNGFLMRQGYTFVSSGWDVTATWRSYPRPMPMGTTSPVSACRRLPCRWRHTPVGECARRRSLATICVTRRVSRSTSRAPERSG